MWATNQGLTDRHAYDSRPQSWPVLRRGIVSAPQQAVHRLSKALFACLLMNDVTLLVFITNILNVDC